MGFDDLTAKPEIGQCLRRPTTCRFAMLGQKQLFPSTEWAGLPLRNNEEDTHSWQVVDGFASPMTKDRIGSSGLGERLGRNLRQNRKQALTIVAVGALAVTFAVLRCAVQGGPNRTTGDELRSLSGVKGVGPKAACWEATGNEFEERGSGDQTLLEQDLVRRTSIFLNSLVTILRNNEPVLARIPVHTRSKILSLLLTLVVQELAALASVLGESSRAALVYTVREVGVITRRLGTTITRKTGGFCSRRLQLYLSSVLRRLELSGPQGTHMPPLERLQKLQDLLQLQEEMLLNLSFVFDHLTRGFSSGNDADNETLMAAKKKLGDLLHTRKQHIFTNPTLSRWLLEDENQSKRFAVATPTYLTFLQKRTPPTVEEMLKELKTLSSTRRDNIITQHAAPADEAETNTTEPSDSTFAEGELSETGGPSVLLGLQMVHGRTFQDPLISGQAPFSRPTPAVWGGWGRGSERQGAGLPPLGNNGALHLSIVHHDQVASSSAAFPLSSASGGFSLHAVSNSCSIIFLGFPIVLCSYYYATPKVFSSCVLLRLQLSALDSRMVDRSHNPQDRLVGPFFGSALEGEVPVSRAPNHQNGAEEGTSNPFTLPDVFDFLRRQLGMKTQYIGH
ncbi:hypothetical protein, conserved [Eimeria maxima]|uniref:Uncharacterized protein n=1 Tax=Eimeria maxima TaxID=5804 RepID=U6M131_EIMMA|nr:hypothetical protein, conserved [Eimeria maxima]CDJ56134.1 hypothetical protein, conserved [Eimeria maxima]